MQNSNFYQRHMATKNFKVGHGLQFANPWHAFCPEGLVAKGMNTMQVWHEFMINALIAKKRTAVLNVTFNLHNNTGLALIWLGAVKTV